MANGLFHIAPLKKLFFYFRFYNLSTHVVTEEVYSLYQIAFGPARNPYRTRLNNTLPHYYY